MNKFMNKYISNRAIAYVITFIHTIILLGTYNCLALENEVVESYAVSESEANFDVAVEEIVEPIIEEVIEVEEPEVVYFNVPLEEDLQDHIFKLCEERGIEPSIIVAMIYRESSFRKSVIGDNGRSYGLMQIQPRWNQKRMEELGCTDLLDPYQNVTVGIDIFADLVDEDKSIEWALMAYNGGCAYANRKLAQGSVSNYVKAILELSQSISKGEKI